MIRAEGSRGNRAEAAQRTPNGNGEVVKGGFLEKTSDLHFGRWVGVRCVEREEEQSEQKPGQETHSMFGELSVIPVD